VSNEIEMQNVKTPSWRNLVLISGHRRSGSTWLAAAFGSADEASLIPYEPLWLTHQPETPRSGAVEHWWKSRGWYIPYDENSAADKEDAHHLMSHLEWLCGYYFNEPVDTLVIKEPHPNWLEFLLNSFRPDKVIYIRRHPLGIVNSYDEHALYHKWGIEREWQDFCQQLPILFPQLTSLSVHARHVIEKVVFMNHVCDLLQERILASTPHIIVEYEKLCIEPEKEFSSLFRWLGWVWDEKAWERMIPIIVPDDANIEEGFIDVSKRSSERATAWRHELAPHLVKRVQIFCDLIGLDAPFPSFDLPSLTREEQLKGYRRYISRRRAYVKQFGLWSTLTSI
jgi:hypothetical protein